MTLELDPQGIVGSIPWNAMVFFTLWMQLLGFSDFAASILMAVFTLGSAFGALIGGALGTFTFLLVGSQAYANPRLGRFEVMAGIAMQVTMLPSAAPSVVASTWLRSACLLGCHCPGCCSGFCRPSLEAEYRCPSPSRSAASCVPWA